MGNKVANPHNTIYVFQGLFMLMHRAGVKGWEMEMVVVVSHCDRHFESINTQIGEG